MSLELNLQRIADAMVEIAHDLHTIVASKPSHPVPTPAPAAAPVAAVAPEPIPEPAPAVPVPVAAVPAAVPVPIPAVPKSGAPFSDVKGLQDYVMGKYRTLGPVKGAMIQNCLSELGLRSVSQLTADLYSSFYDKVEAL